MDRSASALLFLVLSVAISSAAARPEDYWKKVLPNTPMPGAVLDLLRKGDADVLRMKGIDGRVDAGLSKFYFDASAATQAKVRRDPQARLFFLEEELHPGSKLKLDFRRSTPAAAFAARAFTDSMPFSTKDLPAILARFSLRPNSMEEAAMRKTLQACEAPAKVGETKYCATSLESMVDLVTYSLGTSVQAVSTVGKGAAIKPQEYTIVSVGQILTTEADKWISCHELSYPHAVFYCHGTPANTTAYVVPLVGEDGDNVEAVTVCHHDTSAWNRRHPAFQVLNVNPGTTTICHLLLQDHIFWAPNNAIIDAC